MTRTKQGREESRLEEASRVYYQTQMQRRRKKRERINSLIEELPDSSLKEYYNFRVRDLTQNSSLVNFETLEEELYRSIYGNLRERTGIILSILGKNFTIYSAGAKHLRVFKLPGGIKRRLPMFEDLEKILYLKVTANIKVITLEDKEILRTEDPVELADFLNAYANF